MWKKAKNAEWNTKQGMFVALRVGGKRKKSNFNLFFLMIFFFMIFFMIWIYELENRVFDFMKNL